MKKIYRAITLVIVSVFCLAACQNTNDSKAKYIFILIGDGMGHAQIALAESYLSYKADKLGGEQVSFTKFPVYGTCTTHSMDYSVTCSAASGTAIACGKKTYNNYLGIDVNGEPLESIAYTLKNEGYKVAITSNVQVNHATPAAFYAHQNNRNNYYEISSEIPNSGFDFFAGSGFYEPRGKEGENREPINSYIESYGYKVCYGMDEYNAAKDSAEKIVFIQESGRREDTDFYVSNGKDETDISLEQMLNLSIEFLGDDKPFFIMCEGGEIDWAGHENKTMEVVRHILDFEKAVDVAVNFYNKHPEETLIIVTADHETGGAVLGQGFEWIPENFRWDLLENQWKESNGKATLTFEENKALNDRAQIGWTTSNHTGAPVPVFAKGKGAERFQGRIDNSDIKGLILGK